MTETIYLNDRHETVPKNKATRFESYELDHNGKVVLRVYGVIKSDEKDRSKTTEPRRNDQ